MNQNALLVIAIAQAVLRYGPPAVIAIAAAMEDADVTPEDINSLFINTDPEDYFK